MTYKRNKRQALPNKEVKEGAEFVKQYTKILQDYAFEGRLHQVNTIHKRLIWKH